MYTLRCFISIARRVDLDIDRMDLRKLCHSSYFGDGASYCRTGNTEDSRDGCDTVPLGMELSGARLLFFCECRRPADPPAGGAGHVEAGARTFANQGSFVFRERACELVEHASQGG